MNKDQLKKLYGEHEKALKCPSPLQVTKFFNKFLGFLFPEFSLQPFDDYEQFEAYYKDLKADLLSILSNRVDHDPAADKRLASEFLRTAPSIKEQLKLDVQAMYDGDPAARSLTEVVRAYPGFYAIASYRIAHFLHGRSEEHTSELQSRGHLVCRLLLEKKNPDTNTVPSILSSTTLRT